MCTLVGRYFRKTGKVLHIVISNNNFSNFLNPVFSLKYVRGYPFGFLEKKKVHPSVYIKK